MALCHWRGWNLPARRSRLPQQQTVITAPEPMLNRSEGCIRSVTGPPCLRIRSEAYDASTRRCRLVMSCIKELAQEVFALEASTLILVFCMPCDAQHKWMALVSPFSTTVYVIMMIVSAMRSERPQCEGIRAPHHFAVHTAAHAPENITDWHSWADVAKWTPLQSKQHMILATSECLTAYVSWSGNRRIDKARNEETQIPKHTVQMGALNASQRSSRFSEATAQRMM